MDFPIKASNDWETNYTAVYEAILLAVFFIFLGPWISHTNP